MLRETIIQLIEADRERHKRNREDVWLKVDIQRQDVKDKEVVEGDWILPFDTEFENAWDEECRKPKEEDMEKWRNAELEEAKRYRSDLPWDLLIHQ